LRSHSSLRRTPIAAESEKRRKANTVRARVVSAMRSAARGQCARCGRRDLPVHGHERLGRAQGGDILNPDCLLCPPCNGWCEDNPQTAAYTGWKISSKYPHAPVLNMGQALALDGSVVEFYVTAEDVA
jgi:hypothetical protein